MENFNYFNPVDVHFGNGVLKEVGAEAKKLGKHALLVTYEDTRFVEGAMKSIHESLAAEGVECVDFCAATPNPQLSQARRGVKAAIENNADLIIGVGGGSAMDLAKVVAAGVKYPYDLKKMIVFSHSSNEQVSPTEALPMILVPTLPATGSEMNCTAVITDDETCRKSYVWAPACLFAKVAVMDPELTLSLPAYQTACGAVDTVAHIAESYFNGSSDYLSVQDGMQEGVIKAVLANLPRVLANPQDLELRGEMLWAASVALNGWLLSGTYTWAPMHQMGHVLSAQFRATHGATLGVMILHWMRYFSKRADNARYVKFADKIFGLPLADAADKFEQYLKDVGLPTTITEFGAKPEDVDRLTDEVVAVSFGADGLLNSFPKLTRDDVKAIYTQAL